MDPREKARAGRRAVKFPPRSLHLFARLSDPPRLELLTLPFPERRQLYTLYLSSPNFTSVAVPLYITPASTSLPVRLTLSHQLRTAAQSELLKSSPTIDPDSLYREADAAFSALSTLLDEDGYFFGAEEPGLFDASVFAYTHLLLDEDMGWRETRLVRCLWQYGNLVRHRRRIYKGYFSEPGS
ncbi:MAG: hypothetical protein Q9187_009034 [Circinaria calcarea]